jgi:hypothetical protein
MKIDEVKKLGLTTEQVLNGYHFDPMRLAVNAEWNQRGTQDYRLRAIERVIDSKVDFGCDGNTVYELAKRCIITSCPVCSETGNFVNGGGNSRSATLVYRCSCGVEVSLTVPSDCGISVKFPQNP